MNHPLPRYHLSWPSLSLCINTHLHQVRSSPHIPPHSPIPQRPLSRPRLILHPQYHHYKDGTCCNLETFSNYHVLPVGSFGYNLLPFLFLISVSLSSSPCEHITGVITCTFYPFLSLMSSMSRIEYLSFLLWPLRIKIGLASSKRGSVFPPFVL